jgi:hypothetical protein
MRLEEGFLTVVVHMLVLEVILVGVAMVNCDILLET